ncbi:hypothetical protein HA402_005322 [Bradysia odoriphaga]|nr:hypothetical protein HA402_005322 [Bradysia odoriphaga]
MRCWSDRSATKDYKGAARHVLQASFDHCEFTASPNNVAMYGGLCSLATFDRQEMHAFKLLLETEPQLRDIILKFDESKHASCLKLFDEIRDNLLLDMYIAPYTKIRTPVLQAIYAGRQESPPLEPAQIQRCSSGVTSEGKSTEYTPLTAEFSGID